MVNQKGGVIPAVAACMPCTAAATSAIPSLSTIFGVSAVTSAGVVAAKKMKGKKTKKIKKTKKKDQKGGTRHSQDYEKNLGYFGPIMKKNGKLDRDEICHNCSIGAYERGARRFCKVHGKVWDRKTNSCRKKKNQKGGYSKIVKSFYMNSNGKKFRIIQKDNEVIVYSNKKASKNRKNMMKKVYSEKFADLKTASKFYNMFHRVFI